MDANQTDDYGWTEAEGPPSCDYIAPKILSLIEELKVNRVLDLGSGNGALCSDLKKAGYEVVGVEYDKKGVEIARTACPDIRFYNLGVHDDPNLLLGSEKCFDAVVSTEVIEHLFSPHMLPIFAKGVLCNSGYLIISTPYHGYLKNLALSVSGMWDHHHSPLWHGGHIKFWSEKTLTQLLSRNGFKVIGFYGVGRVPYLWKSMILVSQKVD
jgi:2-polyprenyl-3-methyl-5-hydroxy-6-metoxy-1,4-benzoquinol methylase